PVFDEATDCGHTRVDAVATWRRVIHHVWSEVAQHSVEVAAIESLKRSSNQRLEIGRRGLLGHRLPLQVEVGEGVVAVKVLDHPRDPALFDVDYLRAARPRCI